MTDDLFAWGQFIGSLATAGALIVLTMQTYLNKKQVCLTTDQIRQTQQQQQQCSYESTEGGKYIVSKTVLENTSRKPIEVAMAFLLIVDRSVSFEDGCKSVYKEIIDQSEDISLKTMLEKIRHHISNNDMLEVPHKFAFISLPYYFVTLVQAGSLAHNKSTHIQKFNRSGIFSIYFAVLGDQWFNENDTSMGRVVHDEVIVK